MHVSLEAGKGSNIRMPQHRADEQSGSKGAINIHYYGYNERDEFLSTIFTLDSFCLRFLTRAAAAE